MLRWAIKREDVGSVERRGAMTPDHVMDGDIYLVTLEDVGEFFMRLLDYIDQEQRNSGVFNLDYLSGIERAWIELEEFLVEGKINGD